MVDRYMKKEERLKAIWEVVSKIDNEWILRQIHRFCINILT